MDDPAAGQMIVALLAIAFAAAALPGLRRLAAGRAAIRSARHEAEGDVGVLGELVLLGLAAGLTFGDALAAAAGHVGTALRNEVGDVLRRARAVGMAAALEGTGGRAARLYAVAARAAATGAPLVPAVSALVDEARHHRHTRALADARRLPVRLLLPLALLMLPGFVLLTVGPALTGAAERLRL